MTPNIKRREYKAKLKVDEIRQADVAVFCNRCSFVTDIQNVSLQSYHQGAIRIVHIHNSPLYTEIKPLSMPFRDFQQHFVTYLYFPYRTICTIITSVLYLDCSL